MPDPVSGIIMAGSQLVGGMMQADAAESAAGAQAGAAEAGIAEQRRQFDEIRKLLAPYVQAGPGALTQQQALIGLGGAKAQQQAISAIEQSPFLQAQVRQGEEAMLQRASATGGLRGGNMQAALAQFRPAMLKQAIDEQYARLGGLTTLGQQSAVGVGNAGMETGRNVAGLLGQQGAAQAGGILGGAAPFVQMAQVPMQLAGMNYARTGQFGLPSFGSPFGGAAAPATGGIPSGMLPAGVGFPG